MTKCKKMSQTSVKKERKSDKLVRKRCKLVKNNHKAEQKLLNLNNQISKVITKSKYPDQDAGNSLQPNHYHCVEICQFPA